MTLDLPFAYGGPPLTGRLRAAPEDFFVNERLGYKADGAGEHVLLLVEKRDANTQWVARQLARAAGVKPQAVGFAGLKDRHAVTRQAFSVQLPGREAPDWEHLDIEGVRVLSSSRHGRKIKRGALDGNRFVLVARNVQGDRDRAERTLHIIQAQGVPNYFGEQRFGRHGDNVDQALAMFAGKRVKRATRSILLSAARSHIFNLVLAERIKRHCWDTPLEGDLWNLNGTRSWFGPEPFDERLKERLASGDIHPSGPLWGRGELPSREAARALEKAIAETMPELKAGLEQQRLDHDRRPLRLIPEALSWTWLEHDRLEVTFQLPPGAYATIVMRELLAPTKTE